MSEHEQSPNLPANTPAPRRAGRGRFWLIVAAVALFSGITGAVTASGLHHRHAYMAGPMMMMGGPGDAADAESHAAWMAKYFARHVDATPEQKAKITDIAKAAAKDLFPLREKMKEARKSGVELLRQLVISRDDIEKLRAEQMATADAMSKRIAQAIGDMTEVLTPEQRKGLADDISYFARHWDRKRG